MMSVRLGESVGEDFCLGLKATENADRDLQSKRDSGREFMYGNEYTYPLIRYS